MQLRIGPLLGLTLIALTGCSDDSPDGKGPPSDAGQYGSFPVDASACGAIIESHPIDDSSHVDVCSPVSYSSNPPASGHHYPVWAAFTSYTEPVPRGFWVHDIEHGAVVLLYNCPSGCNAEVAEAETFVAGLPSDPACAGGGGPERRIVLTPDPLLDAKWGAAAWGWTLRSSCFEPDVFAEFVTDHYAHAPEDECADGTFIGDGGLVPEPGCGDASATDAGSD
jgi:hypothetical protein